MYVCRERERLTPTCVENVNFRCLFMMCWLYGILLILFLVFGDRLTIYWPQVSGFDWKAKTEIRLRNVLPGTQTRTRDYV
jgi:hypothetical protein